MPLVIELFISDSQLIASSFHYINYRLIFSLIGLLYLYSEGLKINREISINEVE